MTPNDSRRDPRHMPLRRRGMRRFVRVATTVAVSLVVALTVASCTTAKEGSPSPERDFSLMRSPELARQVAGVRAVNLGNALEAPTEGEWGVTLTEDDFTTIAAGGFNAVRVPVRWSAHAGLEAPFPVQDRFFARIDWVLEQARRNGLLVVLDMHHYDELYANPGAYVARFRSIWAQIADRYADRPDTELWFEPLNEPHDRLSGLTWNNVLESAVEAIRRTNPTRPIVFGGDHWNSYDALLGVRVPDDDRIVLTFHYYNPFEFTHQGAEWVDNMDRYLGTRWDGTPDERHMIDLEFNVALRASESYGLPVLLGEFGAYSRAPLDSRARWTAYVARAAEERGFGWAYWEFRAGFGVYDPAQGAWVAPLHRALGL